MPQVDSATKVTGIATDFLENYYKVLRPVRAEREGAYWIVEIDVGVLADKVVRLKIRAVDGEIEDYTIPG